MTERTSLLYRAYCTLADLKAYLAFGTDTSKDDFLEQCINRASRYIDAQTGTAFCMVEYEEKLGDKFIIYPSVQYVQGGFFTVPVTPILEIAIEDENGTALVEDEDYRVEYSNGVVWALSGEWTADYIVTASLGLDETEEDYEVPGDVVQACIEIAGAFSGLFKKTVVSKFDGSIQSFNCTEIPKSALDIIASYRK